MLFCLAISFQASFVVCSGHMSGKYNEAKECTFNETFSSITVRVGMFPPGNPPAGVQHRRCLKAILMHCCCIDSLSGRQHSAWQR